ncbi:hypothetical protein ABEY24_10235 [Peribacillus frigoritolerans]
MRKGWRKSMWIAGGELRHRSGITGDYGRTAIEVYPARPNRFTQ